MRRERAAWWKRRLGPWGVASVLLVLASITLGFVLERTPGALAVEGALLAGAATCYLVGLVRSPD